MTTDAALRARFVDQFGGIYEHSPWVAERVFTVLGGDDVEHAHLAELMADIVDNASENEQLTLIRAHPDLAGKAAVSGELTADSSVEQSSAGLDQCTDEEFATLQTLNTDYKQRFDFPFIMAVRDSSRQDIIAAFAARLKNAPEVEFETALSEIHKIARLRLAAMAETS